MKKNEINEFFVKVKPPEEWPKDLAKNRGKLRLDQYICSLQLEGLESRSQLKHLQVRVFQGGKSVKLSRLVAGGEQLQICWQPLQPFDERCPVPMDLDIIYEDQDLIALNKPQGLAVHGASTLREPSLVQGLIARYPELLRNFVVEAKDSCFRPGLVHRLDKDTSGLLLVARCSSSFLHLREQFAARKVQKTYYALVHGLPRLPVGNIDWSLCRDPKAPWRYTTCQPASPRCRDAHTAYQVCKHWAMGEKNNRGLSLLRLRPKTGRTHQLRVHTKELGCPIVGDPIYGKPQWDEALAKNAILLQPPALSHDLPRFHLMLHAFRLEFCHPRTRQTMRLHAETPNTSQKAHPLQPILGSQGLQKFRGLLKIAMNKSAQ